MNRWSDILACAGLIVCSVGLLGSPARGVEHPNELQQLVQNPIATSRLASVNVPEDALRGLTEALARANVSGQQFNQTLQAAASTGDPETVRQIGRAVSEVASTKTYDGVQNLSGEALADAIHEVLRDHGVPAGGQIDGQPVQGPPPIAQNFVPDQARQQFGQSTAAANRPDLGPNRGPSSAGRQGGFGRPGSTGPGSAGGPQSRPGGAGPPAGAGGP